MPRGVYERKKRKKRSVKTRKRSFIGMISECGGFEQLNPIEGNDGFITGSTAAEVRQKLVDWLGEAGSLEDGSKVAVVEVIEVGHEPPKTFQWDGAKALDM